MTVRLVICLIALLASTPASAAGPADTKAGVDAFMRGESEAAVRIWRPLATAGDADAQYNLGQAYWLGRGVAADAKLAEDWYRRAAEQGHSKARDAYGLLLFQSNRRVEAMPFVEESARRGMPQAQYVYATALFNGDLVEKDWVQAYALMMRASAGGVAAASNGLAQLDQYIPLEQRQLGSRLARVFEKAARQARPGELVAAPLPAGRQHSPAPPVAAVPTATPQAKAAWRVQLGAVASAARANALWGTLKTRVPALASLQSFVVPAGAITRLQTGPLPSRDAATTLCQTVKAAGNPCFPVAP